MPRIAEKTASYVVARGEAAGDDQRLLAEDPSRGLTAMHPADDRTPDGDSEERDEPRRQDDLHDVGGAALQRENRQGDERTDAHRPSGPREVLDRPGLKRPSVGAMGEQRRHEDHHEERWTPGEEMRVA